MTGSSVLSLTLPPVARSARDGRRFIVRTLTDWHCDALVDAAALLASEVITNAVMHARTPLTVSIQRTQLGHVQIEVSDGSPLEPRRRAAAADATTGRGVGLLEELATSWSVRTTESGKTVTFTLDSRSDPWAAITDADFLAGEL
ncbi:MAG: phosphoserine phosphatase RsbU/P [Frankiaceae bacterium]|jgi:anti-sigma regulatory factor (Ser/Thr protein kinase)|nr:phosphoserine phosphatase RsbU/P [Frankiaceae bacterium]